MFSHHNGILPRLTWLTGSLTAVMCVDVHTRVFLLVATTQIIVTKEEDFRTITADEVFEWWRHKISVSAERFDRVVDACLT